MKLSILKHVRSIFDVVIILIMVRIVWVETVNHNVQGFIVSTLSLLFIYVSVSTVMYYIDRWKS